MATAQAPNARPRSLVAGPVARIRWDRVGRVAMLCLLLALIYLYASAGIRIYSTYRQARADRATVAALEREHVGLVHQHESLGRKGTVEGEARRLQMMRSGEQPYVIAGLPGH